MKRYRFEFGKPFNDGRWGFSSAWLLILVPVAWFYFNWLIAVFVLVFWCILCLGVTVWALVSSVQELRDELEKLQGVLPNPERKD
jgi:hypothetical protein